jgi:Cu2+-exporting ATPase
VSSAVLGPAVPSFSSTRCAHCGEGIQVATEADGLLFCCAGCRAAHALIESAGLGAYYQQRGVSRGVTPRVERSYSEFDEPSFAARYVKSTDEGSRLVLFLEGLHCSACVWLLERLPRLADGVTRASLDVGRAALEVTFDANRTSPSAIARVLHGLGYTPHPAASDRNLAQSKRERGLLIRIGVAGALAGNVMLMGLALYSGEHHGMDPAFFALFRVGSLLLAVPSVVYCASVFFEGALRALRHRAPHMDLPVSIGILAGFTSSAWNTLRGDGDVYFDSITVLIFLLLVGRYLQQSHHRRATRAAELIAALAPDRAHLVEATSVRDVSPESLESGAIIEILPSERVPADGVVLQGSSSLDTSWLTGESLPDAVSPGAQVQAGSLNLSGTLRVRVEASGSRTRLGRLLESVERAQRERAPIVRLADRVAGYFVFVILGLSALTFTLWYRFSPGAALDHTVALLVVTCPCALGMATPLAVSVALRRAAKVGVLFKGGEFIEALARPATIAFDKTGTLTLGRLELASFAGDPDVVPLLLAAESRSSHPIARALARRFSDARPATASSVEETPGGGVRALVEGHEVLAGSLEFVTERGARVSEPHRAELERATSAGTTSLLVAVDGKTRAVASFSDQLRDDTRQSLDALRKAGYRIAVLSGDRQTVVDRVTRELGELVDARGGMSPEAKLAWVEAARREGPVVMVGDGVNDAAALSAADVGIAVHGGAEASLAAADVFTTEGGVSRVLEAVRGARRTLRVVHAGLALSLAYNAVGVALAMAGRLSPLTAAILMPLSSLTVVSLALYGKSFTMPRGDFS